MRLQQFDPRSLNMRDIDGRTFFIIYSKRGDLWTIEEAGNGPTRKNKSTTGYTGNVYFNRFTRAGHTLDVKRWNKHRGHPWGLIAIDSYVVEDIEAAVTAYAEFTKPLLTAPSLF